MAFRLLGLCTIFSALIACEPVMAMKTPVLTAKEKIAQTLINKQTDKFPKILKELQETKKKTEHWIWWVFPSEQPGRNEPGGPTHVDLSNVEYLLSNANLDAWSEILEEIYKLLSAKPGLVPDQNIIPRDDHGRIHFSLKFWLEKAKAQTQKYPRFNNALKQLEKYKWWRS